MILEIGKVYTNNEGKFRKVIARINEYITFDICDDDGLAYPGRRMTKYESEFSRWAVSEHDPSTGEKARIR